MKKSFIIFSKNKTGERDFFKHLGSYSKNKQLMEKVREEIYVIKLYIK